MIILCTYPQAMSYSFCNIKLTCVRALMFTILEKNGTCQNYRHSLCLFFAQLVVVNQINIIRGKLQRNTCHDYFMSLLCGHTGGQWRLYPANYAANGLSM